MPSTIFGLPLHPLIVHATVVFVPLAAFAVAAGVLAVSFRRWAGPLPAALSLVALILTPLSTASGENLEHSIPENTLIEEHARLGDQLIPFTIVLFALAAVFWWLGRRPAVAVVHGAKTRAPTRALTTLVGALAVLVALGTGVQVARIGHSGAKAAWSGTGSGSAERQ